MTRGEEGGKLPVHLPSTAVAAFDGPLGDCLTTVTRDCPETAR
jgi:hypothetical protein